MARRLAETVLAQIAGKHGLWWSSPASFLRGGAAISPSSPVLLPAARALNANRAAITKVKRADHLRRYPTLCVLPDGSTINVHYHIPREIIKLPVNMVDCSEDDLRRIRLSRRPREKVVAKEDFGRAFDPMKYINRKS